MRTLAVTGAAGFVGSRLVAGLGDQPVRALVREPADHLPADVQVTVDLLDGPEVLAPALDGVDALVHLAGHNEVVARHEPDRALAETAAMARHVADAAAAAGVRRVVHVSTVHVYGALATEDAVLDEDLAPQPRGTYGISRLACEHLLAHPDLDVVVLRLSNALGAPADPRVDRWTLVAADLTRHAVTTGTMTLRSPGTQWRDFVALDDVCRIVAAASDPDRVAPGTYNLASGRPTTIRGIADLVGDTLERLTGRRPVLQAPEATPPHPRPYRIAVDALASQGLAADTPVEAAVEELARFCIDHQEEL